MSRDLYVEGIPSGTRADTVAVLFWGYLGADEGLLRFVANDPRGASCVLRLYGQQRNVFAPAHEVAYADLQEVEFYVEGDVLRIATRAQCPVVNDLARAFADRLARHHRAVRRCPTTGDTLDFRADPDGVARVARVALAEALLAGERAARRAEADAAVRACLRIVEASIERAHAIGVSAAIPLLREAAVAIRRRLTPTPLAGENVGGQAT